MTQKAMSEKHLNHTIKAQRKLFKRQPKIASQIAIIYIIHGNSLHTKHTFWESDKASLEKFSYMHEFIFFNVSRLPLFHNKKKREHSYRPY